MLWLVISDFCFLHKPIRLLLSVIHQRFLPWSWGQMQWLWRGYGQVKFTMRFDLTHCHHWWYHSVGNNSIWSTKWLHTMVSPLFWLMEFWVWAMIGQPHVAAICPHPNKQSTNKWSEARRMPLLAARPKALRYSVSICTLLANWRHNIFRYLFF
jgi:hypothetical protein